MFRAAPAMKVYKCVLTGMFMHLILSKPYAVVAIALRIAGTEFYSDAKALHVDVPGMVWTEAFNSTEGGTP